MLIAQTVGDMDRLARLLERNGQSALGGDLRSRISSSSGSTSGGGRVSKGGLAAGTAPNRIGADRNGAPVEEIDVGELYKVYDHDRHNATGMIKAASDGGENSGCFTPTPSMVSDMLKGMIVGSRPHTVRKTTGDTPRLLQRSTRCSPCVPPCVLDT